MNYTLPVALASLQNLYSSEQGVQLLGSTVAILPIMIVFYPRPAASWRG
ncbi:MAG: hypothetical protein WKH64_00585 [Chloroflexia bacterium]